VLHSTSFATARFTAFTLKEAVIKQVSNLRAQVVGMLRDYKSWNYASQSFF